MSLKPTGNLFMMGMKITMNPVTEKPLIHLKISCQGSRW
jgi:hypothetical protein